LRTIHIGAVSPRRVLSLGFSPSPNLSRNNYFQELIATTPDERMAQIQLVLLATAAISVMASSGDMGPAAFMWPPDRVWSAQMDNTPPCGSVESPTNRTKFPLSKCLRPSNYEFSAIMPCPSTSIETNELFFIAADGLVALMAQDDSYSVVMSVSFNNGKLITPFTPQPHSCCSMPKPKINKIKIKKRERKKEKAH
jgi:hypothetical protein